MQHVVLSVDFSREQLVSSRYNSHKYMLVFQTPIQIQHIFTMEDMLLLFTYVSFRP